MGKTPDATPGFLTTGQQQQFLPHAGPWASAGDTDCESCDVSIAKGLENNFASVPVSPFTKTS